MKGVSTGCGVSRNLGEFVLTSTKHSLKTLSSGCTIGTSQIALRMLLLYPFPPKNLARSAVLQVRYRYLETTD
jgi:hypothetical protein